jgi:hypothetical protein
VPKTLGSSSSSSSTVSSSIVSSSRYPLVSSIARGTLGRLVRWIRWLDSTTQWALSAPYGRHILWAAITVGVLGLVCPRVLLRTIPWAGLASVKLLFTCVWRCVCMGALLAFWVVKFAVYMVGIIVLAYVLPYCAWLFCG